MPHSLHRAIGAFTCHHLETGGTGSVLAFYHHLFGWTTREIRVAGGFGEMTFRSGETDVATAGETAGSQAGWMPCFAVADAVSLAADAERSGGVAARLAGEGVSPVFAVCDSTGARFVVRGLDQSCAHAGDATAPGRFCWTELMTDDSERAAAFYAAVAGWAAVERHRGPEGRYWVFRSGGREVAGMVQRPEPRGLSCWVPYVLVLSAEETTALAGELGATIETPPGDVPGRGRYAVLRDPAGALVGVFALTDAA